MSAPKTDDGAPGALLDAAVAAARAGGEVVERAFRSADLEVRKKGDHDVVTRADHDSETAILRVLRGRFPDHHVLAEESGATHGQRSEHRWLIDPLDGTANFSRGLPVFAVSVACQHRGVTVAAAILDPPGGNLFTAAAGQGAYWNGRPMRVSAHERLEDAFLATGYPWRSRGALDRYLGLFRDIFLDARGIRRCGAAALDLAYTAAGVYDGFFEFRLAPWDFAAGDLLVREAGGVITDLDGGDTFYRGGNIVAGNPAVHRALLARVADHVSEHVLDAIEPRERAAP